MASGWMKGVVKAVPSGDVVVIMGRAGTGGGASSAPPPEKTITLSSLLAPRLGRRDGSSPDEPFAWAAREFLRQRVVGKEVTFRIDYAVQSIKREFGTVFIGRENVAALVLAEGFAKVRPVNQQGEGSPFFAELEKAEAAAQAAEKGMWTKDAELKEKAVRSISSDNEIDMTSFARGNRNKAIPAIVESVLNGSAYRVTLLPNLENIIIALAGIQTPSMKKSEPKPDGTPGEPQVEPFARDAKYFSETKLLHKNVRVVPQDVDKYNNLYGFVFYDAGDQPCDIALELLQQGLAKILEGSANRLDPRTKEKLRAAERQAKASRIRMWQSYVAPPSSLAAMNLSDKEFSGKVVEVVSGDTVVVSDIETGTDRRLQLSSVRAPRMPNPRRTDDSEAAKGQPYAREAREFLRQRLIGRKVHCTIDYKRKVPIQGSTEGGPTEREMVFASIFLEDKNRTAGTERINVAEMLVIRGLASVQTHRIDEERSPSYDSLLSAEERSKTAKKGMYSSKEAPKAHYNDISMGANIASKAKQYLPSLIRAGKVQGVIEYVMSGHRVKLLIPSQSCYIAFAIAGVRAPGRGDQMSDAAIAFTRTTCLQRDVEAVIETVDRTGTFIGTLKVVQTDGKTLDLGKALLTEGLASTQQYGVVPTEYQSAQKEAQDAKKGIWHNYDPESEAQKAATAEQNGVKGWAQFDCVITEVRDGQTMFAQNIVSSNELLQIQSQLKELCSENDSPIPFKPSVGAYCAAKFSADDQWYRGVIEHVDGNGTAHVFFIDYGNIERDLDSSRLKSLPIALQELKCMFERDPGIRPLCLCLGLAFLRVPSLNEDYGEDAAVLLSELVTNQRLSARIEEREKIPGKKGHPTEKLMVTLTNSQTSASVNAMIVQAGFARLARYAMRKTNAKDLIDHQDMARTNRLNIWQYGDVDSDDEL